MLWGPKNVVFLVGPVIRAGRGEVVVVGQRIVGRVEEVLHVVEGDNEGIAGCLCVSEGHNAAATDCKKNRFVHSCVF